MALPKRQPYSQLLQEKEGFMLRENDGSVQNPGMHLGAPQSLSASRDSKGNMANIATGNDCSKTVY